MTRFWREGHWRTGVYGDTHWVSGHWVDRDGWSSYTEAVYSGIFGTRSAVDSWLDPNATCPVCGASVFFYSNGYGSRVYFDALGPPWPKHWCTDTSDTRGRSGVADQSTSATSPIPGATRQTPPQSPAFGAEDVYRVRSVVNQGKRRRVTLESALGTVLDIEISPPAPPVDSLAVISGAELHWVVPDSGSRGKNQIWRKH